ncbi:TauD/TfdA family dioxygenase [Spirillospora sp. NPDC047279]|uniref:TauD/TfdA family dioxygenase n=1 Tax=Spirillospora sp. NPDC047279 TaxID=3155478 RepID=UPI003406740A
MTDISGPIFELEPGERSGMAELATRLAGVAPGLVDDAHWLGEARRLSNGLPRRLRERLRDHRHDAGRDGLLLIRGLPCDGSELPPTPSVPGSVERAATVPACLQMLIAFQVGEPTAFANEKAGALVQNIVPVPGREEQQSNAGSVVFEMHIENAFHEHSPDYVMLSCLRNDHEDRARLRVASVRRALEGLDARTVAVLGEPRFITEPPTSFGGRDGAARPHPVLIGDPADPDVRVDFSTTHPVDDEAKQAMWRLQEAFEATTLEFPLSRGDLALLDNRLSLHGRTAFLPRYDGRDRWLHRTFIHLDGRRTRPARADNGYVLT